MHEILALSPLYFSTKEKNTERVWPRGTEKRLVSD